MHISDCRKTPSGLSDKLLQSAARIICPPLGDKFHTCSLRSVFCQVHAPAENSFEFICHHGWQTLRDFFDTLIFVYLLSCSNAVRKSLAYQPGSHTVIRKLRTDQAETATPPETKSSHRSTEYCTGVERFRDCHAAHTQSVVFCNDVFIV